MADMLKAILENFLGRLRSSALLLPMVETCRISSQFFGWWARRPEIFYEVTFKHCDPAACPRNQRTYLTVVTVAGSVNVARGRVPYLKVTMAHPVKLVSIATAVPPNEFSQGDVARAAHRSFANRYPGFERLARVFESSGIDRRYAVRPIEWYLQPLGWPERSAAYIAGACDLFVDVTTKALSAAGLQASEIDTVVTVSSTGIATPSLDARVAEKLGFRSDIERVPIFGLGCAGGVSGFSIASRLAASRPGSTVLLVAVEICTLAFRLDVLSKANIVATALFGDGAAACVLKATRGGLAAVEMTGQHMWPDTLDIMGWNVDPQGFGVIFDRAIPPFAEERINPAIAGILEREGLSLSDVGRFACHPGGKKVIEALESALSLGPGALDDERSVLADYGNMSAPTALFVLQRAIAAGLPSRTLLTAMGPGFTVSCASLRQVP
jgi:alkylresorcinol/alkylpyrone synthase